MEVVRRKSDVVVKSRLDVWLKTISRSTATAFLSAVAGHMPKRG